MKRVDASNPHNLESMLATIAKDSDAHEVAVELLEVPLDSVLDAGAWRDVPVLGSLLGLWRTGRNIRDYLFAKKVAAFLRPLATIPAGELREMVERLDADPSFESRLGETLLLVIERLDSDQKALLAGRAFAAYIKRDVDGRPWTACCLPSTAFRFAISMNLLNIDEASGSYLSCYRASQARDSHSSPTDSQLFIIKLTRHSAMRCCDMCLKFPQAALGAALPN